ncbi:MAG: LLM class F420-dependent oxidoreductase [Actinobacteria bacterium]|nr:LLM class F420-dependent oxidoreductase [Actinomycetota bacterium]
MKFGYLLANAGPFATADGSVALGRAAEAAGFESVWTVEHVVVPDGYESTYPYSSTGRMPGAEHVDIDDPLVWLTWVAAHTEHLVLGTGIVILPQRNPAILAKEAATLDVLSGGRLRLGVGVGWLAEEFDALGVPFEKRGARTEEYIAAMRALWRDDKASFDGAFVSFADCISKPKPIRGAVPIIVGGHSDVSARRAGRFGDGFYPGKGDDDRLAALIAMMRESAEQADRDPDTIEITVHAPANLADDPIAAVEPLAAMGVDRILVPPMTFDPAAIAEVLGVFGSQVITEFGA